MAGFFFDVALMVADMGGPTEVAKTTGYARQTVQRWMYQGHVSTEVLSFLLTYYDFNIHDYMLPLPEGEAPKKRRSTKDVYLERKQEAEKRGKKYVPAVTQQRRRASQRRRKAGVSTLLPDGV